MTHRRIAIVLIGTNAYKVLAYRFITSFVYHYIGHSQISFALFSDLDPTPYVEYPVTWYPTTHNDWVEGTNSKYQNIIDIQHSLPEYVYYFDADTGIVEDFDAGWFIGHSVGGEHFANRQRMLQNDQKPYERNKRSACYIPYDTPLPQMYYYGAFWGGRTANVVAMCKTLRENQKKDKEWGFEPGVNDESYLNHYFHYHPPTKVVRNEDFAFQISAKGGMKHTIRDPKYDVRPHLEFIAAHRGRRFTIEKTDRMVLL